MNTELAYDLLVTKTLHPGSIVMVFVGANGVCYRLNSEQEGYDYEVLDGYGTHTGTPDDRILKMTNKINGRVIYYNLDAIESIDIMPALVLFTLDTLSLSAGIEIEVNVIFNRHVETFVKEAIRLDNAKVTTDPINMDAGVGLHWKFGITGSTISTNNTLKINIEKIIYKIPGGSYNYKNDIGMDRATRLETLYAECPDTFDIV